jgi:hypothetical protein
MVPQPIPDHVREDPYWQAALTILLDGGFATDQRIWQHVNFDEDRIDYPMILKAAGWSGGQRRILHAAASLWNDEVKVNLVDLTGGLGRHYWDLLVKAMAVLRHGVA